MDEFPNYFEPGEDEMQFAVNMRKHYTALLRVGFTEEHSIRVVIAAIGTVRTSK
jgi:hypothetical protein